MTRATLHGMTHLPPPAEELRILDAELWQISRGEVRARRILEERPPVATGPEACNGSGGNLEHYR
ncbi:hypothetical protein [Streptomyces viridosporus]|uniref:hypothetical protein n=1 Tax=Streptomyces viridosporus TaxID=67581 RepID=UPI00147356BB|nr:hypothetical protein [Streptomyces viridosporus]